VKGDVARITYRFRPKLSIREDIESGDHPAWFWTHFRGLPVGACRWWR
jgi:hypothetical protein